jgi:hypothetical protein
MVTELVVLPEHDTKATTPNGHRTTIDAEVLTVTPLPHPLLRASAFFKGSLSVQRGKQIGKPMESKVCGALSVLDMTLAKTCSGASGTVTMLSHCSCRK